MAEVGTISSLDIMNCPITSLQPEHYQRDKEGQVVGCACEKVDQKGKRLESNLVGVARLGDADDLNQALGGWWPGMQVQRPQRPLALLDRYGDAYVVRPGQDVTRLKYPVHVLHPVVLPNEAILGQRRGDTGS